MGMRSRKRLSDRFLAFVRENNLLPPGEKVVVAVSGGPDSVCLLHLLRELKGTLSLDLHVAHLNHQLRGADSDADAEYVCHLAASLGLPATVSSRDVKAYQVSKRLGLEEAAREVRYAFLAEVAEAVGARRVAVGHTGDDQVETIILHIVRGSGISGLVGMLPETPWPNEQRERIRLVRPLLQFSRQDTVNYCAEHNLAPREDASNLSSSALRNRIRSELLPLLLSLNPGFRDNLLRLSRLAADDLSIIDGQVEGVWNDVAKEDADNVVLDRRAIVGLPVPVQRAVLRKALEHRLGSLRDIEAVHIEEMRDMLDKPVGTRISLPHAQAFCCGYGDARLAHEPLISGSLPPLEGEHHLAVPGESRIPGWRVVVALTDSRAAEFGGLKACFDADLLVGGLTVRSRRRGDRFQPLGMEQPKKLQDFMVDEKIPRGERDRVPLVVSDGEIIWVVGWRVGERAKIEAHTNHLLCLEFVEDTGK